VSQINYMRVVSAFGGELVSLAPKRAKEEGGISPGMTLKLSLHGETITLDDNVSAVIDALAAEVEDGRESDSR
jgi:hypothetical protein